MSHKKAQSSAQLSIAAEFCSAGAKAYSPIPAKHGNLSQILSKFNGMLLAPVHAKELEEE